MVKNFRELKIKAGIDIGFESQYDDYTFDNAQQVRKLFTCLKAHKQLSLSAQFFKEPLNLGAFADHPDYQFYLSLNKPPPVLVDYLRGLSESELTDCLKPRNNYALCYLIGGLSALEPLFELQRTVQTDKIFFKIINWASELGYMELVERVVEILIGADMSASLELDEALCLAARNGHLDVVNYLLGIQAIVASLTFNYIRAFCGATSNGHLAVVVRLLKVNNVKVKIAICNNYALRQAAIGDHPEVVNLLLEYTPVRLARLKVDSGRYLITQGLKRALWLSLQEVPGFSEIKTQNDLSALASRYLEAHPDWVHASYTQAMKEALVQSLSNQALDFTNSTPLYTMHKCAPNSIITKTASPLLPPGLIDIIEAYTGPQTQGLSHFSEARFEPTRTLALNLFKRRYMSSERQVEALGNGIASMGLGCDTPVRTSSLASLS